MTPEKKYAYHPAPPVKRPAGRRRLATGSIPALAGALLMLTPPPALAGEPGQRHTAGTGRVTTPGTVEKGLTAIPHAWHSARLIASERSADATKVQANELGMVPVFNYHRIVADPQSPFDRAPSDFLRELTRLAEENYVPVTAAEYASGRIDIPAGTHPVVLTFDDGSPSQFALDPAGNPKKDTGVEILLRVAREHPQFRPVATIYVNRNSFAGGSEAGTMLRWLVSHGFEIGNHTCSHVNLSQLPEDGVRKEIACEQERIYQLAGIRAVTLAYPFGARPKDRSWAIRGEALGVSYDFAGIFTVDQEPSPSPFAANFDPFAIPRIGEGKMNEDRSISYRSTAWLDWFEQNPAERYTSDGDPSKISFPPSSRSRLAKKFQTLGNPR